MIDVPYDPDQYTGLLDWLYQKKEQHPKGKLISSEEYEDICTFTRNDDGGEGKSKTGQMKTAKWRSTVRNQHLVLIGEEGQEKVYRKVDETDRNPEGLLQLLQIHEIPEVLHQAHCNVLGHAGQDKTIAEVSCKAVQLMHCSQLSIV